MAPRPARLDLVVRTGAVCQCERPAPAAPARFTCDAPWTWCDKLSTVSLSVLCRCQYCRCQRSAGMTVSPNAASVSGSAKSVNQA